MTIEQQIATGAHMKKLAARIKSADGPVAFSWIGDTPEMGGPFSNSKLEADYQIQHPITTVMHPYAYGGAALGGLAGYKAKGSAGAVAGTALGVLAGSTAESALRYKHLLNARKKLEQGANPLATELSLDQFKKQASLEMISMLPTIGGHFADHRFEQDYTMKHPFISTFHPGPYGGGLAGAAVGGFLAHKHLGSHPAVTGMLMGGAAGMVLEGLHRTKYLLDAKRQLLHNQNPIDSRYTFHQF